MLFRMAWRNIWRNVRRTLITLSAMSLGVAGIVFIHSYNEAAFDQMVATITEGLVGSVQVHGRGYQDDPEIQNVVQNPIAVEARLEGAVPGATAERRVTGYALAGVKDSSSAALVLGLEPEHADSVITVLEGRPFTAGATHEVILGKSLAKQLDATIGSELVLVGQAADGSMANDRYTVVALADAGSDEMNNSALVMPLAEAQDFFGLGQGVHQILVRLPARDDLDGALASLEGALDLKTLEALSWSQILPEIKQMMTQKKQNLHLADFIVFLIVALGVLNTMMMSTFERTREFGVLASVGTRPGRILGLVLTESLFQSLIGLVAGIAIAGAILYGMGTTNLASMTGGGDMMGMRMPTAVPMRIHAVGVESAAITVLITAFLGSVWPALRAARLRPVDAVRHV
jgi:ABC-type lipoprotein release transport system permease subunit